MVKPGVVECAVEVWDVSTHLEVFVGVWQDLRPSTVASTPLKVEALPELAIQVLHPSRDSVLLLSTGDILPLNVCLFIRRGFKTITR